MKNNSNQLSIQEQQIYLREHNMATFKFVQPQTEVIQQGSQNHFDKKNAIKKAMQHIKICKQHLTNTCSKIINSKFCSFNTLSILFYILFIILIYITIQDHKRLSYYISIHESQKIQQIKPCQNPNINIKYQLRLKTQQNAHFFGQTNNFYQFQQSINQIIENSPIINQLFPRENSSWYGKSKSQFQMAIQLLQIVHNINYKGDYIFDHFNFYQSPQKKFEYFQSLLKQQKNYYDKKYHINKYINEQIRMCLFVYSHNVVQQKLYLRNLDSIFQQDYKNYFLIYVNDASTDKTQSFVKKYFKDNKIPSEKYLLINNDVKLNYLQNAYIYINKFCKKDQVVLFMDGVDSLIGRQALGLLNAIYQLQKPGLVYSQYIQIQNNYLVKEGYSKEIPTNFIVSENFRKMKIKNAFNLKTMYYNIFSQIQQQDFKFQNGTFYQQHSDTSIMTPAIQLAGTKIKFLKQIIYQSRSNKLYEGQEEQQIFQKRSKHPLKNFTFVEYPSKTHFD